MRRIGSCLWKAADKPAQDRRQLVGGSMEKPRIFLGSSGKQTTLLQALTRGLEDIAHVEPWTTSFNPGTTTLGRLLELTRQVDFAAFVFAQDD
jgi:predicted nucleotide-binding protein